MIEIIDVYGPSVASTDGADWSRHRRITATPFNERNNRIVWGEALRQTAQLLAYFERRRGVGTDDDGSTGMLAEDSMTLTLNILTAAGLGFSCDFRGAEEKDVAKEVEKAERGAVTPNYRDCLAAVLEDFLPMGLLPKVVWSFPQWLMPKVLQEYDLHKQTLKRFMVEMVEKTRYEGSEHANLLSVLVQKNEEARQQQQKEKAVRGLSDDELYGNVFIYSFAGHETTAHAVCYAMYLLAAYPDVQDWVADEAQSVLGTTAELEDLAYDEIFPRLKRALGVMVSTYSLSLSLSLPHIPSHSVNLTFFSQISTKPSASTRPSSPSPKPPAPRRNPSPSLPPPTTSPPPSPPTPTSSPTSSPCSRTRTTGAPTRSCGILRVGSRRKKKKKKNRSNRPPSRAASSPGPTARACAPARSSRRSSSWPSSPPCCARTASRWCRREMRVARRRGSGFWRSSRIRRTGRRCS